mgnify:FL=1
MTNEQTLKKIKELLEYNNHAFQWNRVGEALMSFLGFVIMWMIGAFILKFFSL